MKLHPYRLIWITTLFFVLFLLVPIAQAQSQCNYRSQNGQQVSKSYLDYSLELFLVYKTVNESDSKLERRIKAEVAKRITVSCSTFYRKIVQGDNPFKIKVKKKGLLGDLLNEALNSTSQMKQAKQEFDAMRRWLLSLQ